MCCRGAGLLSEGLPVCCWVAGLKSEWLPFAGKLVELCREDARNGWGHVGIPSLGLLVRAATCTAQKKFHSGGKFFHYLVSSDISCAPFWADETPFLAFSTS